MSTLRVGYFLAFEELFNMACYALAFVLMVHLGATRSRIQWILITLGLLALGVGIYGVMQIAGIELTSRLSSGSARKISSFYYNQAHYGGLMTLLIPMSWGFFLYATRWFPRLFWLGLFGLLSVNLLFTSSWDAMPFTFAGWALVSLIWAFEGRRYLRAGLVALLIGGLVGLGGWTFTQRPAVVERLIGQNPETLTKYLNYMWGTRLDIFEGAYKSFQESPVWGVGPFQAINHYTLYRAPTAAEGRITHKFVNYAHNDYLEMLSQIGLVGFVGWLGLIVFVLFHRSRGSRLVSVSILGGIVALLLHGITDSNFTVIPATALLAWCLMGVRVGQPTLAQTLSVRADSTRVVSNMPVQTPNPVTRPSAVSKTLPTPHLSPVDSEPTALLDDFEEINFESDERAKQLK